MKVKTISNKKGFTLIETIIYVAIFSVIISGAIVGAYNLIEGSRRNTNIAQVEEEGTFLIRKINWALTGATNVSVTNGGATINITRPDLGAQSPLVIKQTGTNMTITRGTDAEVELNNNRFHISGTNFVYTAPVSGRPASISTTFKIEEKTFNFRNYLRQ